MKKVILLSFLFLSNQTLANQISLFGQHVKIQKQHLDGYEYGADAKIDLNQKVSLGAQAKYFERFESFEKQMGAKLFYHHQNLTLVGESYFTQEALILARQDYALASYLNTHSFFTPFLLIRARHYDSGTAHFFQLGSEFELKSGWIIIPQYSNGNMTFSSPAETNQIESVSGTIKYYREKSWSLWVGAAQGREPAQIAVGTRNDTLHVSSASFGAEYYWSQKLKTSLDVLYQDYRELKNYFTYTTVNFTWMW